MIPSAIKEPSANSSMDLGSASEIVHVTQISNSPPMAATKELGSELPPISESMFGSIRQDNQLPEFLEPEGVQRLHHYLQAAIRTGNLQAETASAAMKSWLALFTASDTKLPVPDAGVGPDGQLLYTWNQGEHHFELEIFPDGSGEFFYLNRVTNEMWGEDYEAGDTVPEEAINRLKPFL